MEGSVSQIRTALPAPEEIIAVCSKVQLRNQGRRTPQSKIVPAANKTLNPATADPLRQTVHGCAPLK